MRIIILIFGVVFGAIAGILLDLVATVIEKQPFFEKLISPLGLTSLVGLAVLGLVIATLIEHSNQETTRKGINVNGLKSTGSKYRLTGNNINVKNSESYNSEHTYENK